MRGLRRPSTVAYGRRLDEVLTRGRYAGVGTGLGRKSQAGVRCSIYRLRRESWKRGDDLELRKRTRIGG